MATTASALLEIARLLKEMGAGTATGGSTTSLIDTNYTAPANWFNGGTIWFLSGNNSGKTAIVTGYNATTKTFSFAAQAGACAAGDRWEALKNIYPRAALVQALNQALEEIGRVMQINSSLNGVADQVAYSLPSGVNDVRRVQVGDNRETSLFWSEIGGQLVFDKGHEPGAGETLYLWYVARHADVVADSDVVTPFVDGTRLAWAAASYAAQQAMRKVENNDPHFKEFLTLAQNKAAELAVRRPNMTIARDPKISGW